MQTHEKKISWMEQGRGWEAHIFIQLISTEMLKHLLPKLWQVCPNMERFQYTANEIVMSENTRIGQGKTYSNDSLKKTLYNNL